MTVPYWLQDSIFYQIFPDRFANGDQENDPPNVQIWGSQPTTWGFQGGDLQGIIQHLDYLLDLGINAIYLTPIFSSSSTHRYNTYDYFQIDPKLGTLQDFRRLIDAAHRNGIRIILDGVFNHCGRGFFAFNDVLENDEHSPFKDWFNIKRFPVDAFGPGDPQNFAGWWNHKALPKFNTSNPHVQKYIFSIARYWLEQGADGWRLDVPNEIDDDGFWAEFRQVVRGVNRDACLIGEIWDINPRWTNDTHFDGLMNYPVKDALLALLSGKESSRQFSIRIKTLLNSYDRENLYAMYVPLDSHDTERFLTLVDGNMAKLKFAYLFLMAFPGAPALFYGDEIGLEGGKDPDCRRAFPWEETAWDTEIRSWIKALISLRKQIPCLRRGDYTELLVDDPIYAFSRHLGEENTLIVLNASGDFRKADISCEQLGWPENRVVHDLLNHQTLQVNNRKLNLSLPSWAGLWLG